MISYISVNKDIIHPGQIYWVKAEIKSTAYTQVFYFPIKILAKGSRFWEAIPLVGDNTTISLYDDVTIYNERLE